MSEPHDNIVEYLRTHGGVRTDGHFVSSNGEHSPVYVTFWPIAHRNRWWAIRGNAVADQLRAYKPDVVLGPQQLGCLLARATGVRAANGNVIWCDIRVSEDGSKTATFPRKSEFGQFVNCKRVAIVDPLLTGGRSIAAMVQLIRQYGGNPVVAGVLLRRSPNVDKTVCNVPALIVEAELDGLIKYTAKECADYGPCSSGVPINVNLGHGREWLKNNPNYPLLTR